MLAFVLLKYDSNAKVRWSDALYLELEEKKETKDMNILQGRSQEETTTEANTRSVVRNQPYEIF